VLVAICRELREAVRGHDLVGRYGGEEFTLLLPEADLQGVVAVAERCRCSIADTPIQVGSAVLHLTMSFGVTAFPLHPAETVDALLKNADEALYKAKAAGRNRVEAADPARARRRHRAGRRRRQSSWTSS